MADFDIRVIPLDKGGYVCIILFGICTIGITEGKEA
jgi:hypothetical protein